MATGVKYKDFKLVTPFNIVACADGDDVTLPCQLSPETSAVAVEIRWFRRTDCIYLYRNGHVIEGRGYEGRVSVDPQQLQRGDVSLTLRRIRGGDDYGVHTCQVISGGHQEEGRVQLRIIDRYNRVRMEYVSQQEITAAERKKMAESVQSLAPPSWWKATDELMEKNRQLEEMKKTLEEKEKQLKEKYMGMENVKQQQQQQQQQEKNKELEMRNRLLYVRDKQMEERENKIKERDKRIEESENNSQEKTKQLEMKDKLLEGKDLQVKDGENKLKEKITFLEESKKRLMEREKMMEDKN
ncbi:trichohyalin-like, partial [Alosa sapidissima]|uniref:trichohyalin-like n=1 Tax=Alosa sapidissima TaxID=34773 RepID=UPI001C0A213C